MLAVTVVIPTHNRRHVLLETLQSVRMQSLKNFEVVIVDDGSTDGTDSLLEAVADGDQVRYFRQANSGQAAARNRGLREARGRYICFLDDDDLLPADKLEWQVAILESETEVDVVGGEYSNDLGMVSHTREDGESRLLTYFGLFYGCPFRSPGQIMARTEAVRRVGGFVEAIRGAEDYDLYVRLSKVRPILRVRRLSLQYREHDAGFSKNYWNMLGSCAMCLRQRLPEVPLKNRWSMSRRAYRWLYEYVGRELLSALANGERLAGVGGIEGWKRLMSGMWPGLLTDPRLAVQFASDLAAPGRLRAKLHMTRARPSEVYAPDAR